MKLVIQFWALLLLVGTAMGKDSICGHKPFAGGNGFVMCLAPSIPLPSFSYISETNQCVEWRYGGCDENANIFKTKEQCEAKCNN